MKFWEILTPLAVYRKAEMFFCILWRRMTQIRMNWDEMSLAASGHAGGGEKGHDIICAGISALTQTLANALNNERGIQFDFEVDEEAGLLRISGVSCWGAESRKTAEAYFRMAEIGLKAIAQEYPDYVKVKEAE